MSTLFQQADAAASGSSGGLNYSTDLGEQLGDANAAERRARQESGRLYDEGKKAARSGTTQRLPRTMGSTPVAPATTTSTTVRTSPAARIRAGRGQIGDATWGEAAGVAINSEIEMSSGPRTTPAALEKLRDLTVDGQLPTLAFRGQVDEGTSAKIVNELIRLEEGRALRIAQLVERERLKRQERISELERQLEQQAEAEVEDEEREDEEEDEEESRPCPTDGKVASDGSKCGKRSAASRGPTSGYDGLVSGKPKPFERTGDELF